MTAIAYRDGVMAADSLQTTGYGMRTGYATKIVRNDRGALAAAAGTAGATAAFREWFLSLSRNTPLMAFDPQCEPGEFAALVIDAEGVAYHVDSKGRFAASAAPFHAEGSASEIMIGAMAAGVTAEEAVKIAIEFHNDGCGGDIQVEVLKRAD